MSVKVCANCNKIKLQGDCIQRTPGVAANEEPKCMTDQNSSEAVV